jgi:hypothetical protein
MPAIAPHYFNVRLSDVSVGLCSLNERVKDFFADSKMLQKQIETNSARLLGN